ncbi:conserved membrane hypothetical protein [Vibrio parahaemolyticus]|uniref:hypothetical protein n=2 Tax=Vibrio TaxID=662 RepID=UPI0004D8012E|nr:hypothetical protein [Vibrio parahaemolyticus]EJC6780172.1 hypothetical protein [Vibrio parahaemolyticus]OQU53298.1 hypothetical protein EM74_000020 [Vibrio parahaemolyticus]HCG5600669.1 hypothetical protein [Vibrio parahaemolyticus]HCG5616842.1 hypothetical protein [Vibrio parahaemolyticus]
MPEDVRREFIKRIEDLKSQISSRYNILNLEAIWLFVATLGCWSVDQKYVQMLAILLVLVFFSAKVAKDQKYDTTFARMLKDIRNDIEGSILEGDSKKARLHELEEINNNLLGLKSIYRSTPMFLMGYAFWAISVFVFGFRSFG